MKSCRHNFVRLLKNISEGIILTDQNGFVKYMNAEAERLTEWSEAEILNLRMDLIFNLIDKTFKLTTENPVSRFSEGKSSYGSPEPVILLSKNGTKRNIIFTSITIKQEESEGIGRVIIFQEIQEIDKSQKQTDQVQIMKSTGLSETGVINGFKNIISHILDNTTNSSKKVYKDNLHLKNQHILNGKTISLKNRTEGILVVDDEEMVRAFSKDSLEHYGYKVFIAENGFEALEICNSFIDNIQLVILDLIMPTLGGRETFYKLKEINPKLKIIMSTGFNQYQELEAIEDFDGFIQKPYEIEKLLSKIRNVLDMS